MSCIPKISDETRQAILRDYQAGVRVDDIAERYGVSSPYPGILADRYGVPRRRSDESRKNMGGDRSKPEPVKVKPEILAPVAEVRRLKAKGLTIEKIGALLRCPYAAVAEALAR